MSTQIGKSPLNAQYNYLLKLIFMIIISKLKTLNRKGKMYVSYGKKRIKEKFNIRNLKEKINNLFWGLKRWFYTDANFSGVYSFFFFNTSTILSPLPI